MHAFAGHVRKQVRVPVNDGDQADAVLFGRLDQLVERPPVHLLIGPRAHMARIETDAGETDGREAQLPGLPNSRCRLLLPSTALQEAEEQVKFVHGHQPKRSSTKVKVRPGTLQKHGFVILPRRHGERRNNQPCHALHCCYLRTGP